MVPFLCGTKSRTPRTAQIVESARDWLSHHGKRPQNVPESDTPTALNGSHYSSILAGFKVGLLIRFLFFIFFHRGGWSQSLFFQFCDIRKIGIIFKNYFLISQIYTRNRPLFPNEILWTKSPKKMTQKKSPGGFQLPWLSSNAQNLLYVRIVMHVNQQCRHQLSYALRNRPLVTPGYNVEHATFQRGLCLF